MFDRIQLHLTLLIPPASLYWLHSLHAEPWAALPADVWRAAPTVTSVGALIRVFTIGVAGWLTLSMAGYVAAKALRLSWATTCLAKATLPPVKRLLDRAFVTTAFLWIIPAAPLAAAPPPVPIPVAVSIGVEEGLDTELPSLDITADKTHRVVPGDSLWTIAAARASGDITDFWLELIEINLETIRSGNPNLIFPGEILRLPVG